MTDRPAADFYLRISGTEYPFFLQEQEGVKQLNDGIAPMITPQFRTSGFGYEHVPPEIEVIESFESWHGGAGYERAASASGRYNYSRGIDRSYEDRSLLSLERRAALTSTGSAIAAAPAGFLPSSLGLFMWAGAYIYQFDVSTARWVERDNASADAADYSDMEELDGVLYAARGQSHRYKYSSDGVTWNTYDILADGTDERFDLFTARGNGTDTWGLWGVSGNVIKNTTDGRDGGVDWVGSDEVGHTGETPHSVITVDNDIYTFKKQGFTRYDGIVSESVYTTRYITDTNGKGAYLHDDGCVYVPYGQQLLKYDPYGSTELLPVYPAFGMDGAEVRGDVTAVGGGLDGLRIAVKNADGNSYILRGLPDGNGGRVWHTVIYLGANDCNALLVAGPGMMHETNPVLVIGYGVAAPFYVLPRHGMRPDEDGRCTFDTGEGVAYGPYVDFGAKTFPKFLNRGAMLGYGVSAGRYATMKYETDRSGSEVEIVAATSAGLTEENELDEVAFHFIRSVLYMRTGDESSSPAVDAEALFATLNPRRKRMWGPVVVMSDEHPSREGMNTDEVPSATALRNILFGALQKRVVLIDREGIEYRCRLLDIQPAGLQERSTGGVERDSSLYQLSLVEVTALTTNATTAIYGEHAFGSGAVFG